MDQTHKPADAHIFWHGETVKSEVAPSHVFLPASELHGFYNQPISLAKRVWIRFWRKIEKVIK